MMRISLIIFLVGLSYPAARPDAMSRPKRSIANRGQRRVPIKQELREQIRQWRAQAGQIKPQEMEQTLKEAPNVGELDIRVGKNWNEVTKLLNGEMKSPQRSRWEKVYVGRHLVALLNRASGDDLAKQAGLLASAFVSAPGPIRELPEPKEDAKKRNAQDEQIMLINQSVDVLRRNFTALLLKDSDRQSLLAVIKKLQLQLTDKDASFVGTVEALEAVRLDRLDVGLAKVMQRKLTLLARGFAGPRQYSVYSEVKKRQGKRLEFGQTELDFKQVIENTLNNLSKRIARGRLGESSEPSKRTPRPPERTPGPDGAAGY